MSQRRFQFALPFERYRQVVVGATIVIANAQAVLKDQNGPSVYHSRFGYASGVLDGVQYWLGRMEESS